MRRLALFVLLAVVGACSKAATPASSPPNGKLKALHKLMKFEINPTFSKLTFLVFHGHELDEEPDAVQAEMRRSASVLQAAVQRLREWKQPPTESQQGREVFYTYANSVDRATVRLVAAIERSDLPSAEGDLQAIASACNSCHHFFRLKIKDSVVPRR